MEEKNLELGLLQERFENHSKEINDLKNEVGIMRSEIQNMKITQVEDRQNLKVLYDAVGEIRDCIKTLTDSIEKQKNKPDVFKEEVYKAGIQIMQYGIIGGIMYYLLNK